MDDNHWTLAQTLFGITTYYRHESDGSLSVKIEGQLEGVSLFDQVAVLREVDLHSKWAPFCSSSLTIAHLDKLDTVGWIVIGLPSFGLMRDACFRAVGCDSMLEDGSILLVAQGIDDRPNTKNGTNEENLDDEEKKELEAFEFLSNDPILKNLDLPAPPSRIGSGRATLRAFQALIQVESPTSARTLIIANVDPNLPFIPQSLVDFFTKKLCGVMLNKLQHAAKTVSKDPINNVHASKMRQEESFYRSWLMPKFQAVCELRNWTMPPVTSLEMTDQLWEAALEADEKRLAQRNAKNLRLYHSMSDDNLNHYLQQNDSGNISAPANIGNGPKIRAMSEDSVLSDISKNSSSVASIWHNNPISIYLRELEERTQMIKAKEIRRAREKASDRLRPKPLDDDALKRLEELRKARQRRQMASIGSETSRNSGEPSRAPVDISMEAPARKSQKRDLSTILTNHGAMARFLVLSLMLATLFLFFSLGPLIEVWLSKHVVYFNPAHAHNIATLLYMVLGGCIHYVLSYISLLYAFSALHIGSLAGREATNFYSQNVHVLLTSFSGSLVAVGFLTASSTSALRWLIWKSAVVASFLAESLASSRDGIIKRFPVGVISASTIVFNMVGKAALYSVSKSTAAIRWFFIALVDSNFVGRAFHKVFLRLGRPISFVYEKLSSFTRSSMDMYEGRMKVPLWREDACSSTRNLLSYTAVFLLVVVILFELFARSTRHSPMNSLVLDEPESSSTILSAPAPAYATKGGPRAEIRSLSPRIETIEEVSENIYEDAFEEYKQEETKSGGGGRSLTKLTTKKSVWSLRGRKENSAGTTASI